MASTHLEKIGIRKLKIVKTLHMDRHGDENDNRNHSNENINPELGNLQNLTKNNADLQNYVSNEQNRIEDARDYLELDNADDFDYER